MKRFEVGHSYEAFDSGLDPITVIKRTAQYIKVKNHYGHEWRMKIRECQGKNDSRFEIVVDSSVGKKWREAFTYSALLEQKEV